MRDGAIVEADVAEPCLAQRNKGVLADRVADVSGLGIADDLSRVADHLQVARDELAELRPIRPDNLDDAVSRRRLGQRGNDSGDAGRGDGLEQTGRNSDDVSVRT